MQCGPFALLCRRWVRAPTPASGLLPNNERREIKSIGCGISSVNQTSVAFCRTGPSEGRRNGAGEG
jgi:hypothetical protein